MHNEDSERLFDDICKDPNYYLYKSEIEILKKNAEEIATVAGKRATLVEFGCGLCHKSIPLVEALKDLECFCPIDVDPRVLQTVKGEWASKFPKLRVESIAADILSQPKLPKPQGRVLGLLAGNLSSAYTDDGTTKMYTVASGTFCFAEVVKLIRICLDILGKNSVLLTTFDTNSNPATKLKFYKTPAYAAYIANALGMLKSHFSAEINLDAFKYSVEWNTDPKRVDISVRAASQQVIKLDGHDFDVEKGEHIYALPIYVRSSEEMAKLVQKAGGEVKRAVYDKNRYICLQWIEHAFT